MGRIHLLLLALLVLSPAACDSGSPVGGSSGPDADAVGGSSGPDADSPSADAVSAEDTVIPEDGEIPEDTSPPADTVVPEDTVQPLDVVPPLDTNPAEDTAPPEDTVLPEDTAPPGFTLTSPAFEDQGAMTAPHVCVDYEDLGISPPLTWTGAPEETVSFALTCLDVSAGDFVHWVIWDIPASLDGLPEGISAEFLVPEGIQGMNGFGAIGWGGPCPPPGGPHEYVFTLWALDGILGIDGETGAVADVFAGIEAHGIGAGATLTGLYEAGL
jgi:Raf kinase inhibitor-like YbhB/YbcL family protein